MITGMDISEKNGSVNLTDLDRGDVAFVYVKASEAINSIDRCYAENIKNARDGGYLVGAYHWLHPRLHVGQQADLFLDTVHDFRGMLPPVVCLQTHRTSVEEMEKSVRTFLEIVAKAVAANPVIYTSMEYWEKHLGSAEWACNYPLWLDRPGNNWPQQIFPWAGWTFWQFSYQSHLPGIPAALGLNWFNGSIKDLESMVIQ